MLNTKMFSLSLKNISIGSDYRFFRVDEWTTNGFWCFKTVYEPKKIKILKETKSHLNKESMDRMLNSSIGWLQEVHPVNNLRTVGETVIVNFKTDNDKTFSSWMNVYFLSFFKKIFGDKHISYKIYQNKKDTPFVFKCGEDVVGLIMPMRIEDENVLDY